MLLVPIQYFLGIVCFLSETLLTNSTERLNARGHLSIFLLCKLTAGCSSALRVSEPRSLWSVFTSSDALSRIDKHKEKVLANRDTAAMSRQLFSVNC